MARFRLTEKHYLNVPGTEWEQIEISRETGKQVRKRYPVPVFLDPDPEKGEGFNYPGEIIVSTKLDPAFPRDIIFEGFPTASMEPLDDDAAALILTIPRGVGPMSEAALPTVAPSAAAPAANNELEEMRKMMAELRGQMTLLVGQNEALSQRLAQQEEPDEAPPPPTTASVGVKLGA